ncbi:hypothetical protein PVAG01_06281 [Phlyctema vagabunda]|uniref:E3 ubiquitin-protein ligase UBR1-like winged-helix domain-containing protein n=1 Tax=Phlyctema vagabunda TaxID=108571 RepID=A0ABR4PFN8_9HELO
MPSLTIPESGLELSTERESSAKATPMAAFGLTLSDSMIEDMIRCVQENKPIQLSLGDCPKINYGSKTQHLSSSTDPFTHEIYKSSPTTDSSDMAPTNQSSNDRPMKIIRVQPKPFPGFAAHLGCTFKPIPRPSASTASTSNKAAKTNAAPADAALAALQGALATENAKKAGNTTKYIKEALPLPGKRGQPVKAASKSKFLSQTRGLNDAARSMPTSPALSGTGSPSLAPTSVPLSEQQATQAKATRRPYIHLLALAPMSQAAISERVQGSDHEIRLALEKVADINETTGKWELRKNYWKELDVYSFKYDSDEDRQKVIDNAVRQYDKARMGVSEPQWDRLLPREERGTGKCLSKLQAKIATGTAKPPKINVSHAEGSGRDTPGGNDDDSLESSQVSRAKGGESMSRSNSQPTIPKTKKTSEREAQAKRLLSKTGPKPAAKPAPKKTKASIEKEKTKALSSQYIEDSDEEAGDVVVVEPRKPAPKPMKRSRDDDVETSDSSNVPLSKKFKKNTSDHRISDASHSSRATHYSAVSQKSKDTSPRKSSPLASSPPTNASDFENESGSNRRTSSVNSPFDAPTAKPKRKYEDEVRRPAPSGNSSTSSSQPAPKRQKSSSFSSSTSAGSPKSYGLPSNMVNSQELMELARKYKMFYPKYIQLHKELSALRVHDREKEEELRDMHDRLSRMKSKLMDGLRAAGLSVKQTQGADWRPVTSGGSIDYRAYF